MNPLNQARASLLLAFAGFSGACTKPAAEASPVTWLDLKPISQAVELPAPAVVARLEVPEDLHPWRVAGQATVVASAPR